MMDIVNDSPFVFDANEWHKGDTMVVYRETKVPHLPIDVDKVTFQSSSIDMLSLAGLLDDSLEELVIMACRIRRITHIPSSVKHLTIQYSSLEELPVLPPTLETLVLTNIDGLDTEVLPPLPHTLRVLNVSNVNIHLGGELPPRLEKLECKHMRLDKLPAALPASLIHVNCKNNSLESLPPLPANLTYLDCSQNRLRELPTLPARLRVLDCAQNHLRVLPLLPACLRTLNFSANPIETYPHDVSKYMYIKISHEGEYFKALSHSKCVLRSGITVFPPSIEDVPFIEDDEYASMRYVEDGYEEYEVLSCVLEIQRQVEGHAFLSAIKEELIAATWHPSRVEAWCGVDFSDPDSD